MNIFKIPHTEYEEEQNIPSRSHFYVISSSLPEIPRGPTDLADLLLLNAITTNNRGSSSHKTLLQVDGNNTFILWQSPVTETSPWTLEEALSHALQFFQQEKELTTCFLFADTDQEKRDEEVRENNAGRSYLVSILNLRGKTAESVSISFLDRFLITAMFYMDKNGRDDQSATLWMHWNTSGSEGFRNQLQFTQPWQTFSDWIATTTARSSNINANTEWFVRLDDQSMIPPELVDETEMRYQEWFRRRYPEMDRIRTSKDYLNRSFYENPFAVEIPIDQLFHPAHCILA
ncbi:hypothetical protein T310_6626, partial [Rasamsonia emersonii CBS 393.64]